MMNAKFLTWTMAVLATAAVWAAEPAKAKKAKADAASPAKIEARAERMVKSAVTLFEQKEDERAIGMLEAVPRMYPESKARFKAHLELGRHFLEARDFDRASAELKSALKTEDDEVEAEALLLTGKTQLARGSASDAVMTLRRLTQDHPVSQFANDAFFTIGQIHFDAGRWARAAEAFAMVGTAVPLDVDTNAAVLAEAGQRVFVHVRDKDLGVLAAGGEKAFVTLKAKGGDSEKAELVPFGRGEGDFLASVETSAEPSQPNDGVLTVHGADGVTVEYVDANTEDGSANRKVNASAKIVSSGSVSFMDGAQRQRIKGVFVDQPAFVRIRDFDLDADAGTNVVKVMVKVMYRERPPAEPGDEPGTVRAPAADAPWLVRSETEIALKETGSRTGVFAGSITPVLAPADENEVRQLAAGEVLVNPEDKLVVEYEDQLHLGGTTPIVRSSEAAVLVGGSTEPQSVVAHSSVPTIQARKLLLEAQLLQKWGAIFKDVGLDQTAKGKAEEGLSKLDELFDLSRRNSLERSVIEQAYETRWNLYLVMNNLPAAISTCQALVRKYPDTALADRAFMQIGIARLESKAPGSFGAAKSVFEAIIALPNSSLKAEAQYRIAAALEDQVKENIPNLRPGQKPDYSAAMQAYRKCAETYPSSAYAGESYKKIVDFCVQTKNYTRAQETLERVCGDYPDAPWLDEMYLKWGIVEHRLGNRDAAVEKFRRILEEYPGGKSAQQAAQFVKKLTGEE